MPWFWRDTTWAHTGHWPLDVFLLLSLLQNVTSKPLIATTCMEPEASMAALHRSAIALRWTWTTSEMFTVTWSWISGSHVLAVYRCLARMQNFNRSWLVSRWSQLLLPPLCPSVVSWPVLLSFWGWRDGMASACQSCGSVGKSWHPAAWTRYCLLVSESLLVARRSAQLCSVAQCISLFCKAQGLPWQKGTSL